MHMFICFSHFLETIPLRITPGLLSPPPLKRWAPHPINHSLASHQHIHSPSMKVSLIWLGGFQTKRFQQSASMRKAQLRVAITTITLKGSSLIRRIFFLQDLSQCWLEKIRKPFSSKRKISWCSVGSLILPLCWFRTTPEVCEEVEIYFSPFLPLSF